MKYFMSLVITGKENCFTNKPTEHIIFRVINALLFDKIIMYEK